MVIDLGEARDEPDLPARTWPPRQRRAVGAVVALVALLLAGGAATPVRSGLVAVTVQATAADDILVEGDGLYLMRPSRGVVRAGLRTVTRYRLPDASEPEWEAALYTAGPVRGVSIVDGTLLVTAEGPEMQTIAIRPDTGQELWRRSGWWYSTGPGRVLLADYSGGVTQQLFSVELKTGDVRWSVSLPADEPVLADRDRVVHWTKAGAVRVHDAGTGDLVASAHLPADPETAGQVLDGLVLVPGLAGGRPIVTAYGVDRLDRRWQADIDVRNEYVGGECGDAFCVGTGDDSGIRLIDRATGRTRWSAPGWGYTHSVGPYLLAYGDGHAEMSRVAVLDPADGHIVAELGEWNTSVAGDDGRILAVREDGSRALVARLDPTTAEVRVLGVLADVYQCQTGPAAVVCRRSNGSIGVWYPRRRL